MVDSFLPPLNSFLAAVSEKAIAPFAFIDNLSVAFGVGALVGGNVGVKSDAFPSSLSFHMSLHTAPTDHYRCTVELLFPPFAGIIPHSPYTQSFLLTSIASLSLSLSPYKQDAAADAEPVGNRD